MPALSQLVGTRRLAASAQVETYAKHHEQPGAEPSPLRRAGESEGFVSGR
jgi:hypothetical protein